METAVVPSSDRGTRGTPEQPNRTTSAGANPNHDARSDRSMGPICARGPESAPIRAKEGNVYPPQMRALPKHASSPRAPECARRREAGRDRSRRTLRRQAPLRVAEGSASTSPRSIARRSGREPGPASRLRSSRAPAPPPGREARSNSPIRRRTPERSRTTKPGAIGPWAQFVPEVRRAHQSEKKRVMWSRPKCGPSRSTLLRLALLKGRPAIRLIGCVAPALSV